MRMAILSLAALLCFASVVSAENLPLGSPPPTVLRVTVSGMGALFDGVYNLRYTGDGVHRHTWAMWGGGPRAFPGITASAGASKGRDGNDYAQIVVTMHISNGYYPEWANLRASTTAATWNEIATPYNNHARGAVRIQAF